jgi:tetraacyldisaccharide 4'-kinase
MRRPEFWDGRGALATGLAPLGWAYGLAGRLRRRLTTPVRVPVPVLCVGNLTVGGSGKTPVAMALARRLREAGRNPHLLSRGYGGRERGPLRVDPARHDAGTVGDEPLLLAEVAPTWVARDRPAGARAACAAGADVIVMDDGFQNPTLAHDLALVVIDGETGFGNGRLLPAGPLRERVRDGLARAGAVVRMGPDRAAIGALLPPHLPCLAAELRPAAGAPDLRGQAVIAFAGIGRPGKLFAAIEAGGAQLLAGHAFADHHPYRRDEIESLLAAAERAGAVVVTTVKDRVRLPRDLRDRVRALPVEVVWSDPAAVDGLLARLRCSRPITLR